MNRISNTAKLVLCFAVLGVMAGGAGAQEVLEQWAFAAVEVSSNGDGSFEEPLQIVGLPDSDTCEPDAQQSWRTWLPDAGPEWVEMRFATSVYAFAVEIHESLNPGAVTVVSVRDEAGELHTVWEGVDTTRSCPGVFRVEFPSLSFPTNSVEVRLNTELVPGFNRIDALKLIGFVAEGKLETFFETASEEETGAPPPWIPITFVDYDHDGWPDALGADLESLDQLILLHNEGNGTFSDRSSLLAEWPIWSAAGGKFADYDNDGDMDLFIGGGSMVWAEKWPDALLRNDGGWFTDVTAEAGLQDTLLTATTLWWDYDLDGWLDLYISRGDWHWETRDTNSLYRNQGDGTFVETTAEAGLDVDFHPSMSDYRGGGFLGIASADFNGDGWPDLYVPVRLDANRLFLNDGSGYFRDATTGDIGDVGEVGGVAVGDINNDGKLDIFQPSPWGEDGNQRWRSLMLLNLGDAAFLDVTDNVGLELAGNCYFPSLEDFDNDGDLDLLIDSPSLLFVNDGDGTFTERTFQSGLSGTTSMGDYSGDGFLDSWTVLSLHPNRGNDNHYLRIELVGFQSSRDGIGTQTIATSGELRQLRELDAGNGTIQNDMTVHFGLGEHTLVDELELRWLSGQVDMFHDIPADQTIRIIEGRGEWYPAEKTVWEVEPPESLDYGQKIDFVAVAKPALFEPTAEIVRVTGDLSSLGGSEAVPLEDLGDGTYKLETSFVVGGTSDLRDVEVFIEQETSLGPYWINLSRNIEVVGDPNTVVTESYAASIPGAFTLVQNYPNPFNSATVIRFALPTAANADLAIFNLAGQRVAQLAEGAREAGTYTVRWDGHDDDGRALASGVYLYRLRMGDGQQVETRKLLLLR